MNEYLLEVKNLKKYFPIHGGVFWREIGKIYALDDVSLNIRYGETVGLVGESGCGKTTFGRTILNLYKPTSGNVLFDSKNILKMNHKEMQLLRRNMQIIFQDPFESLNSRHTIFEILEEPLIIHKVGNSKERRNKVFELLNQVGLSDDAASRFPHEFSGGQRQRIGIARALALNPKLVVCDEPVSALDVSIQSQILNLLLELQVKLKLTYLFIAHDLAVVKHISDRIAVMYLGKIVEYTDADTIYNYPIHPYTKALISSIPVPNPENKNRKKIVLKGDVPSSSNPPSGCRFHTRCNYVIDICKKEKPSLLNFKNNQNHQVACHRAEEIN
jgi:oligopeptide/dipeptide ABC transporter ATP-binding protein